MLSNVRRLRNLILLLLVIAFGWLIWSAVTTWLRDIDQRRDHGPVHIEHVTPSGDTATATGGGQQANFPTGYVPDPEGTKEFLRSLPKPTLRDAGPELFRARGPPQDDKPVLLYRALNEAYAEYSGGKKWVVGTQGIGDCVSWGFAHAADVHLAVMWKLGDSAEWHPAATEAIYGGARVEASGKTFGGWSDGTYGAVAAKWLRGWGILFRQPYNGVDLSRYSSSRAKQWGAYGCGGKDDSGKLDTEAKTHPVRNVALVTNFAEAAAAIQSGYPVAVCSGQGFTSTRDKDGFLRASGSWSHCMCFIGVRFDRPGLLLMNSWGPTWVSGPVWPDDQPAGSFWVEAAVATRMLSGKDSFAVSGYEGFPYRKLDHGSWVMVRPRPASEQGEAVYALAP